MKYLPLDTETTGVEPPIGVVELGYALIDEDLSILKKFNTLVDPEMPIPKGASKVHGIYDDQVELMPTMDEIVDWPEEEVVLICHNTPYDRPLVESYLNIVGEICTLRMARRLWPTLESHTLQFLIKHFELGSRVKADGEGDRESQGHAAIGDVLSVIELLDKMAIPLPEMQEMQRTPYIFDIMPIGKHKGKDCCDVPTGYWNWVRGAGFDPDMHHTALHYLRR